MQTIGRVEGDINGKHVSDNRRYYDLSLAPVENFVVADPGHIGWDGDVITSIVNGPMRQIAEELHGQLLTLTTWDEEIASAVRRDSQLLGLGGYGPSQTVCELNEMLCDMLRDLLWEVETGASQLWLAYDAHMRGNTQAAAELATLNSSLPEGSGYNPWDFELPQADLYDPMAREMLELEIWFPGGRRSIREMMSDDFQDGYDKYLDETKKPESIAVQPKEYDWKELGE
jgi:hypothetical protein